MESRFNKLAKVLENAGIDAYYCRNTSDIRWLTSMDGVFDTEQAHLALISGDSFSIHTDGRYSQAMRSHPNRESLDILDISDEQISHMDFAANRIADSLPANAKIGVESNIALDEFRALDAALSKKGLSCEIVEMKDPVTSLRAVKDLAEVEIMRQAQQITDRAFSDLLTWIAPGLTELEVASRLEYSMRLDGAQSIAFASIVASGPLHSAMPHAIPSSRKLEAGDLVVIDFGAKYGDYCSDMTRTVAIGEPSAELKRIYDAVLLAHEECKKAIRPGIEYSKIHALAEQVINEAGYEGYFTHSLGHGVGIDIHELPRLSSKSEGLLEVGNVVTVEPGIYVPGVGGVRIEDFGVVTTDGFDDFTASAHELQCV